LPDNHLLDDDWTVVTDDGRRAAHWEHTGLSSLAGLGAFMLLVEAVG
jgi:methionyl aminopeptidase